MNTHQQWLKLKLYGGNSIMDYSPKYAWKIICYLCRFCATPTPVQNQNKTKNLWRLQLIHNSPRMRRGENKEKNSRGCFCSFARLPFYLVFATPTVNSIHCQVFRTKPAFLASPCLWNTVLGNAVLGHLEMWPWDTGKRGPGKLGNAVLFTLGNTVLRHWEMWSWDTGKRGPGTFSPGERTLEPGLLHC